MGGTSTRDGITRKLDGALLRQQQRQGRGHYGSGAEMESLW
jgi:hypothetical protein